jgi:hypothetical protein
MRPLPRPKVLHAEGLLLSLVRSVSVATPALIRSCLRWKPLVFQGKTGTSGKIKHLPEYLETLRDRWFWLEMAFPTAKLSTPIRFHEEDPIDILVRRWKTFFRRRLCITPVKNYSSRTRQRNDMRKTKEKGPKVDKELGSPNIGNLVKLSTAPQAIQHSDNAPNSGPRKAGKVLKKVRKWGFGIKGEASVTTVMGVPVGAGADLKIGGYESEEIASEEE